MAGGPSENSIRDRAAKRLEALGCWVLKTTRVTPGRPGVPDLILCDPGSGGRMMAQEFKKPVNPAPLTAAQQREIEDVRKAGGMAVVVRSVEESEEALREMRAQYAHEHPQGEPWAPTP